MLIVLVRWYLPALEQNKRDDKQTSVLRIQLSNHETWAVSVYTWSEYVSSVLHGAFVHLQPYDKKLSPMFISSGFCSPYDLQNGNSLPLCTYFTLRAFLSSPNKNKWSIYSFQAGVILLRNFWTYSRLSVHFTNGIYLLNKSLADWLSGRSERFLFCSSAFRLKQSIPSFWLPPKASFSYSAFKCHCA